ncbi:hypothetical protein RISK_004356 [Rhodopirellula islandica]|uniref:Uncharacterized protein n=1 Tax=Rhodopirellula islandica TaxID=595434 RepID=A0A0J1EDJ4_RHOIS|nr:hypothetical protein RISK_004356 [Rhodopirellula islandica]
MPEAIAGCENEGYVLDSFDAWYDRKIAAWRAEICDLGEPDDARVSPS